MQILAKQYVFATSEFNSIQFDEGKKNLIYRQLKQKKNATSFE